MAQRGRKGTGSKGGGSARAGAAKGGQRSAGGRSGAQARRAERRPVPGWVWLVLGGALGAGVLFVAQVYQEREGAEPIEPAAEVEPEPDDGPEAEADPGPEAERRYEFYELLMEDEVSVPEEDLAEVDERRTEEEEREAVAQTDTFEEGHAYLLQAGSFRSHEDAESMRATLALVGLPAQIHTVELDEGEEWHRVRVGPFEDGERLEEARMRMEDNDIQPMMLRDEG